MQRCSALALLGRVTLLRCGVAGLKQGIGSIGLGSRPHPLRIPRGVLEEAYRDARATFPAECCGWLAGPKGGTAVTVLRQCVNAQSSGTHPTTPGRGSETQG